MIEAGIVKKQLWLALGLILVLSNGDCFGQGDTYVSRRYRLSDLRQFVWGAKTEGGTSTFGLRDANKNFRKFNLDDQCALEECLEQQIPGPHWASKKARFCYVEDEVLIHQPPEIHKKIKLCFDQMSAALHRSMRLEIRRYEYRGENILKSMKVGAPLTAKDSLRLKKLIEVKTVQLISSDTIFLRDGEVREISKLTQRKLLYNGRNDLYDVGAETVELTTGRKTTVSVLRSIDGNFIDLKVLFEKAKLSEITMLRYDPFFFHRPTVSREFLEAGVRLNWNLPHLIRSIYHDGSGQFVLVKVKKRRVLNEIKNFRVFPIEVLEGRWTMPGPVSPWTEMRIGPQSPPKLNRKKLAARFLNELLEDHVYSMSGLVYLVKDETSSLLSQYEKRFKERNIWQAQVTTRVKSSKHSKQSAVCINQWSILGDQTLRFGVVNETLNWSEKTRSLAWTGLRRWTAIGLQFNRLATGFSLRLSLEKKKGKRQLLGEVEFGQNQSLGFNCWGVLIRPSVQFNSKEIRIELPPSRSLNFIFNRPSQETTRVQLTALGKDKQ